MNIFKIIDDIAKVDPEVYDRLDGRRQVFKHFTGFGSKVAMAAVPLALSSVFRKAYGQSNNTAVIAALQFALKLEYLETEFYNTILGGNRLSIPSSSTGAAKALETIRYNENTHVDIVRSTITELGGTPMDKPAIDITGGNGSMDGPYKDAATNYAMFLTVAHAFEDTGVRAYKGQAGNVMSNDTVLQAALQIHSVEARHAAQLRILKMQTGVNIKPWITGNEANGAPAAVYAGEEMTMQANVNIMTVTDPDISMATASEAFDEPLTKEAVEMIVDPFFA